MTSPASPSSSGLLSYLNIPFIDTTQWFCLNLTCPPIIDDAPAFADGAHISAEIAPKLAPVLRGDLRQMGVQTP